MKVELPRRYSNFHELDLNLKLLKPLGIEIRPDTIHPILQVDPGMENHKLIPPGADDYIVIHPGSKGSAANWPPGRYWQLIEKLSQNHKIVITGQGEKIDTTNDNVIDLVNETNLDELMSILSNATLFISGSTGPLHMAAALGVPSLGLYPDHPVLGAHRWGPRGKKTSFIEPVKQSGHKCRINNNGSCECMETITVDQVYNKALEMLNPRRELS
jgi:ADP-heptose:LPS heptosyltransferase